MMLRLCSVINFQHILEPALVSLLLYEVSISTCSHAVVLSVETSAGKTDKPSRYRRKKGLHQLFSANKDNEDASN